MDEYGAETVSVFHSNFNSNFHFALINLFCFYYQTMREALKTWNKTVQFWLASNVYRRLSNVASRNIRTLAVMAISSAWHGVYAGYYLSLGSVVFVLPVEDLYERILRRRLIENNHHRWVSAYDWTAWFFRYLSIFSLVSQSFKTCYWQVSMVFVPRHGV